MRRRLPVPPGAERWTPSLAVGMAVSGLGMVWRLARARRHLATLVGTDILTRNRLLAEPQAGREVVRADAQVVGHLAWLLPRVARRVPWRSDCLVQAMAAQDWLAARGIGSRIVIGVDPEGKKGFEAHAWLVCGERIVTGGDVSAYATLVGNP